MSGQLKFSAAVFILVSILVASADAVVDVNSLPPADVNSSPLNWGFTLDYYTKYIWRGQNLNDRSVFQPSIYLSKYGFTGTIWGNQDWTNANDNAGNFTEFDYSIDYTHNIPGLDWLTGSVGNIQYTFPHTGAATTNEVYGGLTINKVPLNPSIKIYRDLDEIKGTYYQFGVGHEFEKLAQWKEQCYCGLSLGASVGYGNGAYNKGYFGSSGGNMNDLTLTAGLPICLGEYIGNCWTIKPSVNYATLLSDPVRATNPSGKSDNLWFGLSISAAF